MVAQADSTLAQIKTKVRRLTASSSTSSLSENDLEKAINIFYNNDFPYAIKLDQMRNVYTFFTEPNRDRYPLDVNYNQGIREPVYVDGVQGWFYKDRKQFFNIWPKWPTLFKPISGDGITTVFNFTIPGPFLSGQVTLGGTDASGNPITVTDDGNGNLLLEVPNPVTINPSITTNPPIPGMHNANDGNPGLNDQSANTAPFLIGIGQVNYVTGAFAINFPVAPASGTQMNLYVSQYQTGKPYSLLFWNNEFTIRPVPKLTHRIEVETYLTPVQFLQTTDNPIIQQWAQYLAYGSAMEILRERQDMEGVENLREGFMRQEALVLERQGVEEIGQRNSTIFSASTPSQGWNNGFGQGWM